MRECTRCGRNEVEGRKRLCEACRSAPPVRCKKCKKVKQLTAFSHDATRPSGYFPWCKLCQTKSTASFQNPEDPTNGHVCPLCDTPCRGHANRRFCSNSCKDRVSALKNKFRMSVEQYRLLLADTEGRCPICQERPTKWNVDHNHETHKVTGLVCTKCNIGVLAYSKHSVEYVRSLLSYLEQTPAERLGINAEANEEKAQLHKRWKHKKTF